MASIALCVQVLPSRALRAALLGFACAAAMTALAILLDPAAVHFPTAVCACCASLCALTLHARSAQVKAHQIDISGLGQIRLTVQQHIGQPPAATPGQPCLPAAREVRLLPASTLWPRLLLLLLRDAGGGLTPVLVLPDSVPPAAFRALACACRAIQHRGECR